MRLVTVNTWGTRGDWPRRLSMFQDCFRALDPDIVTLQETVLTDEVDQAAEMLGDGYHLAQQQDREPGRAGAPAGQGITTASAWEASHHGEPLVTYTPQNPHQATPDWPFRSIDHVFVRCGPEGPTLMVRSCYRVFDQGILTPSDHYGIAVVVEAFL